MDDNLLRRNKQWEIFSSDLEADPKRAQTGDDKGLEAFDKHSRGVAHPAAGGTGSRIGTERSAGLRGLNDDSNRSTGNLDACLWQHNIPRSNCTTVLTPVAEDPQLEDPISGDRTVSLLHSVDTDQITNHRSGAKSVFHGRVIELPPPSFGLLCMNDSSHSFFASDTSRRAKPMRKTTRSSNNLLFVSLQDGEGDSYEDQLRMKSQSARAHDEGSSRHDSFFGVSRSFSEFPAFSTDRDVAGGFGFSFSDVPSSERSTCGDRTVVPGGTESSSSRSSSNNSNNNNNNNNNSISGISRTSPFSLGVDIGSVPLSSPRISLQEIENAREFLAQGLEIVGARNGAFSPLSNSNRNSGFQLRSSSCSGSLTNDSLARTASGGTAAACTGDGSTSEPMGLAQKQGSFGSGLSQEPAAVWSGLAQGNISTTTASGYGTNKAAATDADGLLISNMSRDRRRLQRSEATKRRMSIGMRKGKIPSASVAHNNRSLSRRSTDLDSSSSHGGDVELSMDSSFLILPANILSPGVTAKCRKDPNGARRRGRDTAASHAALLAAHATASHSRGSGVQSSRSKPAMPNFAVRRQSVSRINRESSIDPEDEDGNGMVIAPESEGDEFLASEHGVHENNDLFDHSLDLSLSMQQSFSLLNTDLDEDAEDHYQILSEDLGLSEHNFNGVVVGGVYQHYFDDCLPVVAPASATDKRVVGVSVSYKSSDLQRRRGLLLLKLFIPGRHQTTQTISLGRSWQYTRTAQDGYLVSKEPFRPGAKNVCYYLPRHPMDWAEIGSGDAGELSHASLDDGRRGSGISFMSSIAKPLHEFGQQHANASNSMCSNSGIFDAGDSDDDKHGALHFPTMLAERSQHSGDGLANVGEAMEGDGTHSSGEVCAITGAQLDYSTDLSFEDSEAQPAAVQAWWPCAAQTTRCSSVL